MRRWLQRLTTDRAAATAIEYSVIAALIAMVIIAGAQAIGGDLVTSFDAVSNGF